MRDQIKYFWIDFDSPKDMRKASVVRTVYSIKPWKGDLLDPSHLVEVVTSEAYNMTTQALKNILTADADGYIQFGDEFIHIDEYIKSVMENLGLKNGV